MAKWMIGDQNNSRGHPSLTVVEVKESFQGGDTFTSR